MLQKLKCYTLLVNHVDSHRKKSLSILFYYFLVVISSTTYRKFRQELLLLASVISMILPNSIIFIHPRVSKSPPPNAYEIKSDFEEGEMKGKSFGEGREQMKITGPFVKSHKNKNPGPGTYNSLSTLNKISYSMNGKNVKQDK